MQLLIFVKLIFAFLLALYFTPRLIKISKKYGIYDDPGHRKIHKEPVSFLGGIGLFIAFYLAHGILIPIELPRPPYVQILWFSIVGNFLLGMGDDFFDYKPIKKFFFQFLICGIMIFESGLILPFEKILPVAAAIPYFNLIMSMIVYSAIINAYNLIDGLDGLATSLSIVSSAALITLFTIEQNNYIMIMCVTFAGSLIGFLFYNRPRAMIFMGDSGSYFIGATLATFIFIFICEGNPEIISTNHRFQIGLAIIIIPALDMTRLFLWRILNRINPFTGDNSHIHHLLIGNGFTTRQTILALVLLQLIFIGVAVYYSTGNSFWIYSLTCAIVYLIAIVMLKLRADKRRTQQA